MKRREFLQLTGVSGLGLLLGCTFDQKVVNASLQDIELDHFIFIDTKGVVTLLNHAPELGQGVFQAVPMIIAEELEVDIYKINIVQADADRDKYEKQNIGGSTTVRRQYTRLREIGAGGKTMLIQAAAHRWECSPEDCYAELGQVVQKTTKDKFSYGDLVEDASLLTAPEKPDLKKKADFKILGKSIVRQDMLPKVNGQAEYGQDIELDNMLYASVLRTPYIYGSVASYNKEEVEALPGVVTTIHLKTELVGNPREAVAVLSEDYHSAFKARNKLEVEWSNLPDAYDNKKVFDTFHDEKSKVPHNIRIKNEDKQMLRSEKSSISAEYECPYQTHSPMEPMNATVWVKDDSSIEAWLPTQHGQRAQDDMERVTGIPIVNITVHVPFVGGGFGRRSLQDFAIEAAILSQQTNRPVKVIWTREDDTKAGPFRPATLNVFKAGFDKDKKLTSFSNHIVTQIIGHQRPDADKTEIRSGTYAAAYWGYNFANYSQSGRAVQLPIPIWYWRSVYSSTNCFVNESFVDEVAHHMGEDPMDFRIRHMEDERAIALLKTIRKQSNWDNPAPGEFKGIGFIHEFETYLAQVVTVEKSGTDVRIKKVDALVDCGQTINPDTIRAQVEGSIVMALTATYKSATSLQGGQVVNDNFDTFELLRIDETPEMDVRILETDNPPGGIGEPGFPPTAPALTNAIFNATGIRIRKLPVTEVRIRG